MPPPRRNSLQRALAVQTVWSPLSSKWSSVAPLRRDRPAERGRPDFASLKANYKIAEQMVEQGIVASASSAGYGGLAEARSRWAGPDRLPHDET